MKFAMVFLLMGFWLASLMALGISWMVWYLVKENKHVGRRLQRRDVQAESSKLE